MKSLSEFPETIYSSQVVLRTLAPSDENAKMIFDALDACRDYISAFQGFVDEIKSPDDVLSLLNKRVSQRNMDSAVCFGIFHNDEFIGRIRFKRTAPDAGYVGYWQAQSASGHGYMTMALSALETELFKFGFDKITLEIDDGNTRSVNLAMRSGYQFLARRPMASCNRAMGKCDELVFVKYKNNITK